MCDNGDRRVEASEFTKLAAEIVAVENAKLDQMFGIVGYLGNPSRKKFQSETDAYHLGFMAGQLGLNCEPKKGLGMTRTEYMLALNLEGLYKAFEYAENLTPQQAKALDIAHHVLEGVVGGKPEEAG